MYGVPLWIMSLMSCVLDVEFACKKNNTIIKMVLGDTSDALHQNGHGETLYTVLNQKCT